MMRAMRWLDRLARVLVAAVLGFLGLPWCVDLLVDAVRSHLHPPQDPWAVALGAAAGLVLAFFKRPNHLLHTALHEACHALLCLLTAVRIRKVEFSDSEGGAVVHDQADPFRGTLILIAPYTVPLVLAPVLIARMWVHQPGTAREVLSGLCAGLFITHVSGLVRNLAGNFWPPESDCAKVGRPLSLVLIAGVLLLLSTWALVILWER